ncbi:ETC complex I subunit conserved region-domain-containing protein [Tricharina praecox]|uniref:ETC complex I subunit conserved region-domain-containing protein n=1 Tax=Tricharina praecox TaxID=43433 RepID=UPI00221E7F2A|nr:ETC complex I subunit conserved region-domain-containing protein [Tricharina praecox]KAI5848812.1 ETC complex I subunit conserved region-domain-containing protein [Tricharina praecox]
MRPTTRLLTARLPAFSPTGITGVLTHPHPRPALIALYNHTLSVLSSLPSHSVYRQSAENLTRARLEILKSVKPAGWNDYLATRRQNGLQGDVDITDVAVYMRAQLQTLVDRTTFSGNVAYAKQEMEHWRAFAVPESHDTRKLPQNTADPLVKDLLADAEHNEELQRLMRQEETEIDLEPQLTAEQVMEIEEKIGEGLLEEVIEEGWGELQCAETMRDDKVWEPLEVVPEEGQWVGFERQIATP